MSEEKKFTPKSYQEGLAEEKLQGTRCTNCGTQHLPPRHICPACHSRKLEWKAYRGEGIVTGITVIYIAPTFMADITPYKMAIVKLDDGPSITGLLEGKGETKVGDRVTSKFTQRGDKTIIQFKQM